MTEHTFDGRVAILGLGYIGLPTAAALATRGVEVVGVDVNPHTVAAVSRGEVPFVEPDLAAAVSGAVAMGRLTATTEVPQADAYIIAVPTPFNDDHTADLRYVRAATEAIAPQLRGGEVVILESTSPPGTTEGVSRWLAELRPDLVLPHSSEGVPDVYVAHCPERVLPGRIMIEMVTNDRVIGGVTPRCARAGGRGLPGLQPGPAGAVRRGERRDGQAGRERLPRRQHRLRQRALPDQRGPRARRVGSHPSRQPPPAGQRADPRPGRRAATASRWTRGSSSGRRRNGRG